MFDERGMLSDRARGILFWITISLIVILAIVALITILRACGGLLSQMNPPLTISPDEASLCPGEQQQFVASDVEVVWEATGGVVSESGLFTAGDVPGDYIVTATQLDSSQTANGIVHVVSCTPTAAPVLSPTAVPVATPTPESIAPPPADPQGDVGTYESGTPVEGVPAGVDIRAASIAPDLRVVLQPTEGVPVGMAGWVGEGEILLWVALHEPVPDPPAVYMNWIFALDVDGNTATGRPPGSARINPDLADDAVIGVSYNTATGAYESYAYVWDAAQGNWTLVPDAVRPPYFDDSRTLIGLAMPLETLTQAVAQTTGATLVPEAVRGRVAAETYVDGQRVIDFYPNRP